jgi:chemotaxis protein histidine kinase CheA
MPHAVPTPVAAALGLVPAVLDGVRRLPGRALQLPVLAVGSALTGLDAARREYDDLAGRGERLVARLRGTSFDEFEDHVEEALQGTPLARPYDAVEDALEDAGAAVAGTVSDLTTRVAQRSEKAAATTEKTAAKTASKAATTTDKTATKAATTAKKAATKTAAKTAGKAEKTAEAEGEAAGVVQDELPAAEQPKGAPTPTATQPDATRIDTAAAPDVVETVEQVSARSEAPTVAEHDDLPLADYDHMTLGSLRGRLRSLTVEQLVQVRDYEKAHADRLPVVTMLDNRIAKLASDSSAEQPSGVPSDRPAPGQGSSRSGSKVSPATGGPAQNPPSAGVPTNPAQPRTAGSPGTNPNSSA